MFLQAEFSVVMVFPGELNLQWDFSILFLKFLSPTFLTLILSLQCCWDSILCFSSPKPKVRANFPLNFAIESPKKTLRAYSHSRRIFHSQSRSINNWVWVRRYRTCTERLCSTGHPAVREFIPKRHPKDSLSLVKSSVLKGDWELLLVNSLVAYLCFNHENIVSPCASFHALLLLKHHLNLRNSPSVTEYVFAFPIATP